MPLPRPPAAARDEGGAQQGGPTATCKAQSLLSESFNFLKNTPDVETFETWAGYRNPSPLALLGNDGRFKRMSTDLVQGLATTAGLSAATFAAAASAAVVYLATCRPRRRSPARSWASARSHHHRHRRGDHRRYRGGGRGEIVGAVWSSWWSPASPSGSW